jgi:hypothetical protein
MGCPTDTLGCSTDTIDERIKIREEVSKNHTIALEILNEIGQNPEFLYFYQMIYNPECRCANEATGQIYSGGDKADLITNVELIGSVNSCIIGYRKEGEAFFEKMEKGKRRSMPQIYKEKIIELVK